MATIYLLDSNSFIEPAKKFYQNEIAPSFWKQLAKVLVKPNVCVLDVVYNEISKKDDWLSGWLKSLSGFSKQRIRDLKYVANYARVINYIKECGLYNFRAINQWSDINHADPWLVTAGITLGARIVTFETARLRNITRTGTANGKIYIPDVADHFGVNCENLYEFMKEMRIIL